MHDNAGMISLDLEDDLHITIVYLGPDVPDTFLAEAAERAKNAASSVPGPITGYIEGRGTFPSSESSDWKIPVYAHVLVPGADVLRALLEDLSKSEHKEWVPHMTLQYIGPDELLPKPVPRTPVVFSHLSVHRGKYWTARFPFKGVAV